MCSWCFGVGSPFRAVTNDTVVAAVVGVGDGIEYAYTSLRIRDREVTSLAALMDGRYTHVRHLDAAENQLKVCSWSSVARQFVFAAHWSSFPRIHRVCRHWTSCRHC